MSRITEFYNSSGVDHKGRTLTSILAMDDDWLEVVHDYIQWIFPLEERSKAVPNSPVMRQDDINAFKGSFSMKANMAMALQRMLIFYGFECSKDGLELVKMHDFQVKSSRWLTNGNHNYLRLTRIMKSLALVGLSRSAQMLQKALLTIADEFPSVVSPATRSFWADAFIPAED